MSLIIDSQYFYGVDAYKILCQHSHVIIDIYENFQKMSFRNRCRIATASGEIDLSIPMVGGRNAARPMKESRIAYREDWQKKHWGTIVSAYNRSPWFEYSRPELESIYQKKEEFLLDWNMRLFDFTNRLLGIKPDIKFTKSYLSDYGGAGISDFRGRFRPSKKPSQGDLELPKYHQVFEERLGFLPGLSVIDLLFCEGPGAAGILIK